MRNRVWFLVLCFLASNAVACGPNFPNWLLGGGDSVLAAPFARFEDEIARIKTPPTRYSAKPATNQDLQTADAELADLRSALKKAGTTGTRLELIARTHAAERARIQAFRQVVEDWEAGKFGWPPITNPPPVFTGAIPVAGLPAEFADYFQGVVAWYSVDTNSARAAWNQVLALPKAERHFKSTWAAYMLGRSWEDSNRKTAILYYQQVRKLVDEGFADSVGLAYASLGREARMDYLLGRYLPAIELFLQQASSNDRSALISLRWVAAAALQSGPSVLKRLARNPNARRVITAYLISGGYRDPQADVDGPVGELIADALDKASFLTRPAAGWHKHKPPAVEWLEAIESADVRDLKEAERLALAAYQAGEFDEATRWLNRASVTAATRWLRAKLLLRDGKVNQAAAQLAAVVREFPPPPAESHDSEPGPFVDGLSFASGYSGNSPLDIVGTRDEIQGELGALHLVRREYTEALDALLRSGFWMDAAYVAERVLTVEELRDYIDRNWPVPTSGNQVYTNQWQAGGVIRYLPPKRETASDIRYLLARRLLRLNQRTEARPYFPKRLQPLLDELDTNLVVGLDQRLPKPTRAAALWNAARMLRKHGMELIGTEVEPDWAIHGGSFDVGVTTEDRIRSQQTQLLPASDDEIRRAQSNNPIPNERFHYRYVAAHFGWEAAKLMPNNRDQTARVLCIAGSWLKDRDPKAADVFYKALVRRCRKTVIGAEADRKRWFPTLDPGGNLQEASAPDNASASH